MIQSDFTEKAITAQAILESALPIAGFGISKGIARFGSKGARSVSEALSKFLDSPAISNGALNIEAGSKPIQGAYNIDIAPKAPGVNYGDGTNLSNIKTASQSKIIIENPYNYDPLNPEVLRVLSQDGEIIITGSRSQINKILKTLDDKGLQIKGDKVEIFNDNSFKTTTGENIISKWLDQYTIIRKKD